jgi:hypothetical protein
MRTSLKRKASHAAYSERHCRNCEFVSKETKVCPYLKPCTAAFIRGFTKGYKQKQAEYNESVTGYPVM